jgi:hypothetical protein
MVPENKMKKGCPKHKNSAVLALLRPGGTKAEHIRTVGICPHLLIHLKEKLTLFKTKGANYA